MVPPFGAGLLVQEPLLGWSPGRWLAVDPAVLGVWLTWTALANLLNTTTITANHQRITVKHGPIHWYAPDPLATGQVDQLFVFRKTDHSYQVRVRMQNGRCIMLLGGIRDDVHARYIEKRLEAYLGLEDRAVPGEFKG